MRPTLTFTPPWTPPTRCARAGCGAAPAASPPPRASAAALPPPHRPRGLPAASPPFPPSPLLSSPPAAQKSKWSIKPRSIQFHIVKKESGPHWPSLTKDKAKEKGQVSIDWTRYVDEDEEKGGFDTSAMGGGMNFGGMGGEDDMAGMMGGMGGVRCPRRAASLRAPRLRCVAPPRHLSSSLPSPRRADGRHGRGRGRHGYRVSALCCLHVASHAQRARAPRPTPHLALLALCRALMKQFGGGAGGMGGMGGPGGAGDFGGDDDGGDEDDEGADELPPLTEDTGAAAANGASEAK